MSVAADPALIREQIARVPHWYHQIELPDGTITPGHHDSHAGLAALALPEDLRGKRVLDLGTRDGYFAFACEARGAEVVAIDYLPKSETGFATAAGLLGSQVRFEQANAAELCVERFGRFDVVLCLGLLYHLRAPLDLLDRIRTVCDERLWLETLVVADRGDARPVLEFFPRDSRDGDYSNYWAPNPACLEAMVEEAGFAVERTELRGERGIVVASPRRDPLLDYHARIARGERLPER